MKNRYASLIKRASLLAMLAVICAALTACYMEPDRVVDNQSGLDTNEGMQGFENVITPVPSATPVPTPKPTAPEKDWSSWAFDTPTDPPSGVTIPAASVQPQTTNPQIIGTTTVAPATAAPVQTSSASSGSAATPTPKPASLQLGAEGSDVKRMQQQLKNLGYYTGSVDGKFGQGTLQAVRDFQAAHKLTVDGKAGSRTINMLYSSDAKKKTAATVTAAPSGGSSSSGSSSGSSSTTITTSSMYTNGETDIYLEPGTARSSQVKILQNRLIVLGYLTGTAHGDYDETTTAAVKAFQKRNDLHDDGIAGPTTLAKLYSSSARKASSVVGHLGSLKEGMNGSAVRALQKNLKTLGYYSGSVDGDYGAGTSSAVMAFQKDNGLKADGIAGKATLNAIQNALSGGSSSGSSGSSSGGASAPANYGKTASSNGYTTIHSGTSSSSNVTALQSALSATGYYSGSLDGKFGSGTEEAVKKYQRSKGLRVTGMAGPSTQRLLYGGTAESGSYSKLQVGSKGSAVKRLQYALYELKYYDGAISGTFDNATENAVMVFQEVNGLAIDGVAGQDTQRRLFSSHAKPCDI